MIVEIVHNCGTDGCCVSSLADHRWTGVLGVPCGESGIVLVLRRDGGEKLDRRELIAALAEVIADQVAQEAKDKDDEP